MPAPKKPTKSPPKKKSGVGSMALQEGQKRLLIGGAVLGGALLYRHFRSGTVAAPRNTSATGTITPFVPQSPVLVPPGESIYDPNSQALLNTPFAPVASGTGTSALQDTPLTPAVAMPAPPPVATHAPLTTGRTTSKPTKRKVTHPRAVTPPKPAAAPRTATAGKAATRKVTKRSTGKPRKFKKGTVIQG